MEASGKARGIPTWALVLWLTAAPFCEASSSGNTCERYFTQEECTHVPRPVDKAVFRLMKTGSPQDRQAVIDLGLLGLPALLNWADKKPFSIVPFQGNPYPGEVFSVIAKIHDKNAIPVLKKMAFADYRPYSVSYAAMLALVNSDAELTGDEVNWLLQSPYAHGEWRFIMAKAQSLPPDQRAEALIGWLKKPEGYDFNAAGGGQNIHNFSQFDQLKQVLELLGQTRSREALNYLAEQVRYLSATLGDKERTANSEHQMNWFSDTGRQRVRDSLKTLPMLISEYKMAMAQLAKDIPVTSGLEGITPMWPNPNEVTITWLKEYQFSFDVWALSPEIRISLLIDGKPLVDKFGHRWDHRAVTIAEGQELPFEQQIDVIWKPTVPPKYITKATIMADDQHGNVNQVEVYALTLSKTEPKPITELKH